MFTFQRASYSVREKVCETYSVSFIPDYTSWLALFKDASFFFRCVDCTLLAGEIIMKDEFENTPKKTVVDYFNLFIIFAKILREISKD